MSASSFAQGRLVQRAACRQSVGLLVGHHRALLVASGRTVDFAGREVRAVEQDLRARSGLSLGNDASAAEACAGGGIAFSTALLAGVARSAGEGVARLAGTGTEASATTCESATTLLMSMPVAAYSGVLGAAVAAWFEDAACGAEGAAPGRRGCPVAGRDQCKRQQRRQRWAKNLRRAHREFHVGGVAAIVEIAASPRRERGMPA